MSELHREASPPSPPDILRYSDYREFLSAYYAFRKAGRAGFSFRAFAAKAGFSSPNYLQLVIQGQRNLSNASAVRVARALGLKGAEAAYFAALVEVANAENAEDRECRDRHRLRIAQKLVSKTVPTAQAEVLSSWYLLPMRELVQLADFEPTGDWIAARLRGAITPAQAEAGLKTLLRAGFLRESEGRLHCVDPVIETPPDGYDAVRVLEHHRQTLVAWTKLLEVLSSQERELGLLNIPISSAKVPEFKRRIRAFQDEVIGWLQDEQEADQIVQLGTYLIPVTRNR